MIDLENKLLRNKLENLIRKNLIIYIGLKLD